MKFTKEQLVEKITEWEQGADESFTDYFMHDNVKNLSWAFWLLGKCYTENALVIIRGLEEGETYFDQETLFEIYPEYTYDEEKDESPVWQEGSYEKNIEIWAEFLVATDSYQERVFKFFKENEDE